MLLELPFVFVMVFMSIGDANGLATTPIVPMKLINRDTWKICHSMTYWCVQRRKRNMRIIFVFCVDIPTLEEALCDVFEDKFWLAWKMRGEF